MYFLSKVDGDYEKKNLTSKERDIEYISVVRDSFLFGQ